MSLTERKLYRCNYCRTFRENYLRKRFYRLQNQDKGKVKARYDVSSHATYKSLTTAETKQRMHNMQSVVESSKQKISNLQAKLDRLIQLDGVNVDQLTHHGLVAILKNNKEYTRNIFFNILAAAIKGNVSERSEGTSYYSLVLIPSSQIKRMLFYVTE